eukprot:366571-Chlamydomonas_euryale.AAC.13
MRDRVQALSVVSRSARATVARLITCAYIDLDDLTMVAAGAPDVDGCLCMAAAGATEVGREEQQQQQGGLEEEGDEEEEEKEEEEGKKMEEEGGEGEEEKEPGGSSVPGHATVRPLPVAGSTGNGGAAAGTATGPDAHGVYVSHSNHFGAINDGNISSISNGSSGDGGSGSGGGGSGGGGSGGGALAPKPVPSLPAAALGALRLLSRFPRLATLRSLHLDGTEAGAPPDALLALLEHARAAPRFALLSRLVIGTWVSVLGCMAERAWVHG